MEFDSLIAEYFWVPIVIGVLVLILYICWSRGRNRCSMLIPTPETLATCRTWLVTSFYNQEGRCLMLILTPVRLVTTRELEQLDTPVRPVRTRELEQLGTPVRPVRTRELEQRGTSVSHPRRR